jgi:L-ascorbate metabolism protein UlaG (beta-lactamase superfamily)
MPLEKIPEKNTILFVWFNHYAGILIKTPSKTIVIDPVDVKPRNLQETGCQVIADPASTRSLKNIIPPSQMLEIRPGEETKIGEVTVKAEKCQHPAAQPVTFIITSEDGVKTFHTADSLPFPEMAQIGEKEKLDIAFCTVGIAPGASAETGFEIARLTKPQIAVPYHTNSTASQKRFAEILKAQMPRTACLIPELNKIYQVTKRK